MGNAIAPHGVCKAAFAGRGNALQVAQREATRERLIEGAIRAFTRKGYAACVVADVLAEAQVSRASFYAHFASMQALVDRPGLLLSRGAPGGKRSGVRNRDDGRGTPPLPARGDGQGRLSPSYRSFGARRTNG